MRGRHDPARWLCLAAAPTFAVMALVTWAEGGGPLDTLCTSSGFALSGMAPMYALMSVFHAAPWLRLVKQPAPHRRHSSPPLPQGEGKHLQILE